MITTQDEPKPKTTTASKEERIARLLEDYLKLGSDVGAICDKRDALLKRARRSGLRLHRPIQLADGTQWELRKTEGKYVHFAPVELKKVPKFKRTPTALVANTEGADQ